MKKFLNLRYALIVLALGIAAITIYAKTGGNQQPALHKDDPVVSSITTDLSNSSKDLDRSDTLQTSKAKKQIQNAARENQLHENTPQIIAQFQKWNEQDISDAIVELKSLNDIDVTRITDVYAQAFDEKWTPAEHHWTFLEACYEEYAEVCDNTPYLGNGCMLSTTAQAMHNLAKHRIGQKSPKSKEWFSNIYRSIPKFFMYIEMDIKLRAELGLPSMHETTKITPIDSQQTSAQDVPEIKNPFIVE